MPKWLKTVLEFTVFWMQRKGYVDPHVYDKKVRDAEKNAILNSTRHNSTHRP